MGPMCFLSTTANTNRNHKETWFAPFSFLKNNTPPPVQCPAGHGKKHVCVRVGVHSRQRATTFRIHDYPLC